MEYAPKGQFLNYCQSQKALAQIAPVKQEPSAAELMQKAYDSLDAMIDKARYDPATAQHLLELMTYPQATRTRASMSAIRSSISVSRLNFCRPSLVEGLRQLCLEGAVAPRIFRLLAIY